MYGRVIKLGTASNYFLIDLIQLEDFFILEMSVKSTSNQVPVFMCFGTPCIQHDYFAFAVFDLTFCHANN